MLPFFLAGLFNSFNSFLFHVKERKHLAWSVLIKMHCFHCIHHFRCFVCRSFGASNTETENCSKKTHWGRWVCWWRAGRWLAAWVMCATDINSVEYLIYVKTLNLSVFLVVLKYFILFQASHLISLCFTIFCNNT